MRCFLCTVIGGLFALWMGHKEPDHSECLAHTLEVVKQVRSTIVEPPKSEVEAMVRIAWKESRHRPDAQNPKSSAYGLFQFTDSTWKRYGGKTHDPYTQTLKAWYYVEDRYGTAEKALSHHERKGWY